jgi:glycosyltransferase involved in cell wall biosynthesis
MKWIVAAPYPVDLTIGFWKAVQKQGNHHELLSCQSRYKHNRSRNIASKQDWSDYWQHSNDTWAQAQRNKAGIITAFPQLAVCVGMKRRLSISRTPLIAGTFNLGQLHKGYKKQLARIALKRVDKFIVHSSAELTNYSKYLNLPQDKFEFIRLHKPIMAITELEDVETPFLLSMGSANRDYKTLFSAIKRLQYPLTIVAPKHILANLDIPSSVTIKSNLSIEECRALVQKALINIIPIDNQYTASGQVTVIEAMMYNKAVIATDTLGTRDYIENGKTGLLVSSKSVDELESAIETLWTDSILRKSLADQAKAYVKQELSQEKAASQLLEVLNKLQ